MCGSSVTTESNPFCCARDNSVFPSFGACSVSPSCRVVAFYSVSGRVITPDGFGIAGVDVRGGPDNDITDEFGNFNLSQLPDLSSGTVVARKNSTINSTSYSIAGADVTGLEITLNILGGPPEDIEICDNGVDDDMDQFGWNSMSERGDLSADRCDSDCAGEFGMTLSRTVTFNYFRPGGEYLEGASFYDKWSDGFCETSKSSRIKAISIYGTGI